MSRKNTVEDFWNLVDKVSSSPCWLWKGCVNGMGYGQFRLNGKQYLVHRLSYALSFGEPSKELDVHHWCKNTLCVNPIHLDEVTAGENLLFGLTGTNNGNTRKVCCPKGHYYDGINSQGSRICKICGREASKRYYNKMRKPAE